MKNYHWISMLFISASSLIMAFIFLSYPTDKNVFGPIAGAFIFLGMLGSATAAAIRTISKRLDDLEQFKRVESAPKITSAEQLMDVNRP